jgi:hypothetical protein
MRRLLFAAALSIVAAAGMAQTPSDPWHAKGREIYERAVEIPTVAGRGKMGELVTYLRGQYESAGITDIRVFEHADTQSMVIRWPAARPSGRKAILIRAHMDVVEARREDWERDPFELIEEGGYFYGRGTGDNKLGVVSVTTALLRLKAQGFRPDRDIVVLFTGDEETAQEAADKAANEWLDLSTIEYGLNADGGGGAFLRDGTNAGFQFVTSEKVAAATVRARAPTMRSTISPAPSSASKRTASSRASTRPPAPISPSAPARRSRRSRRRCAPGSPIQPTAPPPTSSRPARPKPAPPAPAASRPASTAATPTTPSHSGQSRR